MKKNLIVGILRETRNNWDRRTPLTPADVKWLVNKGIDVEVETSENRVFKDQQYKRAGAKVLPRLKDSSLLLGVKQPEVANIYQDNIYMVFPHAVKGQSENMSLLREFIKKKTTLIDYEKIVNSHGKRLVYFGRFAGICGLVDSLYYLGKKLEYKGIENPFAAIRPAYDYSCLEDVVRVMRSIGNKIKREGLPRQLSPFIIGIAGRGHVGQGVEEILKFLKPVEIHPRALLKFTQQGKHSAKRIYKTVFMREEKFRQTVENDGFYVEKYLRHPEEFESNMDVYLPHLSLFINASYWDSHYPRLVTKEMIDRLSRRKKFRLEFIGDISCDVSGSIELTYKITTQSNPVFTYDTKKKAFFDGYEQNGVTVLAIDNLPAELPKDSSQDFSNLVKEYVYQIAVHGARDVTNHTAIPKEIRRSVITQSGKLTSDFTYLKKYLT